MEITLYVNVDRYGEVEVETEQEHLERIQNHFDIDMMDNLFEGFEEYLDNNYSAISLFEMDEVKRNAVLVDYRKCYFESFDTNYHWEKVVKEIEIGD